MGDVLNLVLDVVWQVAEEVDAGILLECLNGYGGMADTATGVGRYCGQ